MKKAIQRDENGGFGKFQFQCPHCESVHDRSIWSVAHADIGQTFKCGCGYTIVLPPMPR